MPHLPTVRVRLDERLDVISPSTLVCRPGYVIQIAPDRAQFGDGTLQRE
jgi:hypothetical protein